MARKRELTWFPSRKCWSKWYQGRRVYLATGGKCRGKSDQDGYELALAEWEVEKARIDSVPSILTAYDGFRAERDAATERAAVSEPMPVAAFASDYSKLPKSIDGMNGASLSDKTIAGLIAVYLREKRSEVSAGQISPKMHAEHKAKLDDFNSFARHFQRAEVNEIDGDLLAAYRQAQLDRIGREKKTGGISRATARKRLQIIERFLKWAYKREALDSLPRILLDDYARVKLDAPRPLFYTPDEVRTLYDAASPRLRAAILLAVNAGFTQQDVSSLTWEMIDQGTRIVSRERSKTGVESKHRLWPQTLDAVKKRSRKRTGPVLTGPQGALVQCEILPDGNIKLHDQIFIDFRGIKRKLKWQKDKRSFKHLRKSAANEIARQFQDAPQLVDAFLAHSEKAMKRHYVSRHYEKLFEAIDFLDGLYQLDGKLATV